jgi:hypothetical protein
MLRTIFAKKESDTLPDMAATIDAKAFKDALDRYPAFLKSISKPRRYRFSVNRIVFEITEPLLTRFTAKEGQLSLEELDNFRYNGAPVAYSVKTGRLMENSDLQKLVDWKM